jgi:hypothetical protein
MSCAGPTFTMQIYINESQVCKWPVQETEACDVILAHMLIESQFSVTY